MHSCRQREETCGARGKFSNLLEVRVLDRGLSKLNELLMGILDADG